MNSLTRIVLACAIALSTSLVVGCGGEEPKTPADKKTDTATPAKDAKPADKDKAP